MAMLSMLNRINHAVRCLEQNLFTLLWGRRFPPDALCMAIIDSNQNRQSIKHNFSLKDIIGDGFLWAVPKSRRSIEKRLKRKFALPWYLLPRTNLKTCNVCGGDHEIGVLCPTCYQKVMDETKAMQDKIQENLGLEPVDKEVVVVYDGEKDDKPSEYWEGKRIVEMKKARPNWFSKNLLQQTTQKPATTSDIKPSQLG